MTQTNSPSPTFSKSHQTMSLAGWVLFCFLAASSALITSPIGWYANLNKPVWNPPPWLFGPVWSLLYVMMAVAAWLVWRDGGWRIHKQALGCFLIQWVLNALWTPLFFGLHLIGGALAEILLLWMAVAMTLVLFWRVKRVAGILLIPYLAWVSLAALLNFMIWRLNR